MEKNIKKIKIDNLKSKGMGFFGEFKKFITKGNVLDLAVGVIIGGAFTNIVNSLIKNIISPILGFFMVGGFDGLTIKLWKATLNIGTFAMDVINFLVMAFVVFLIVKFINKVALRNKDDEKEEIVEKKSNEEKLLEEIRDLLKEKRK